MKKSILAIGCILIVSFTALVACSDDESVQEKKIDEYMKSIDDLDSLECNEDRDGMIVYFSETDTRMVCYEGKWIKYFEWKAAMREKEKPDVLADDTVSNYSNLPTCNYSRDKDVYYVKSLNINLICVEEDGKWLEFALQSVPDTVSSMSALPVCLSSITGARVYLSSMKSWVICSEREWIESTLWLQASSSSGAKSSSSSSRYSSSSYYSSSSINIREATLGYCTAASDGELAYDSNGVIGDAKHDYYVCDGDDEYWYAASNSVADTIGWKASTDGTFKPGAFSYSSSKYSDLSTSCVFKGESGQVYYVYDGDHWREAKSMEVCMLYACTKKREGETRDMNGYTFVCRSGIWGQDSLYKVGKKDYFSKTATYATLTDARDNKTYKTVDIGGLTWMAEDLNYADTTATPNLISGHTCYGNVDSNCVIGGRSYRWASAMNLSSTYNSSSVPDTMIHKPHQGICPTGWHVPDSTEWRKLYVAAGNSAVALKASGVWPYSSSVAAPSNATGFTALPSGYAYGSYSYSGNLAARYCSAHSYSASYAWIYTMTYSSNYLTGDDYRKSDGCHLRCVKDL